ncbi:MAG: type II toxin-antitoxin system Phd/YefM family antitoxin [candidate division KSB1 bacterium]|nr:type II toxin-antitoxin system Phd/YefM family antitoxin [candidate division KSB1 bacterium]MDZ7364323.1 type II toxin-antitoxin system Phd/YefM family antitoxin [candidate division KSB1 bacterium]MDZ7402695.1 type II toxin-antitoxin system Phd/YefM family antitoxin [candidate division KSB1 bacterium]
MKFQDTSRSLGHLMTHADQIIAEMNANRHPVIITHKGEPCAVLQDFESYERQHDALIMLQLLARWQCGPGQQGTASLKRKMEKAEPRLRKIRKAS